MVGRSDFPCVELPFGSLAAIAAIIIVVGPVHAQTATQDLGKISGEEYLRLCRVQENEHSCLQAVYTGAAVNRLLDVIKNQRTFCPRQPNAFPPADIVSRVTAWLDSHPRLLDKPSDEALSAALLAMYPCQ